MAISGFGSAQLADGDDMAKRANIDHALVELYVARLLGAVQDRAVFDRALDEIKNDPNVKAGELGAIAVGYSGGGRKPANRAAAIAAIGRRFVDIV